MVGLGPGFCTATVSFDSVGKDVIDPVAGISATGTDWQEINEKMSIRSMSTINRTPTLFLFLTAIFDYSFNYHANIPLKIK